MELHAVILCIIGAFFFGWCFGFIAFLYRYKRTERCYLCDTPIVIKELIACPKCRAHARTLSDNNLAREMDKIAKTMTDVEVYRIEGQVESWRNRERYETINATVMCRSNIMSILKHVLKDYRRENSLSIKKYNQEL